MSEQNDIDEETAWLKREHEEGLASGLAEDLSPAELLLRMKAEFYGIDEEYMKRAYEEGLATGEPLPADLTDLAARFNTEKAFKT